jgi:uncharacterized protein
VQLYLPIAELPVNILLIIAMSMAVGFISGLFGIGGGFLMTPLLIFMGIPPAVAVASTAAQITASSTTGALTAWRKRQLDLRLGAVLIGGGVFGTLLGVLAFNALQRIGRLELTINLSYMALLGSVGILMFSEALRSLFAARAGKPKRLMRHAGTHPEWMKWPLRMRFHRSRLYSSVIPIAGVAATIGFIGAVLGIGGGFILVPLLLYVFRIPTAVVVGTSQFQILMTMASATIFHAVTNHSVDIVLALLLIIGGAIGAQFGARSGRTMKADSFRLLLAILLLGVAFRFGSDLMLEPSEHFSVQVLGGAR